MNYTYVRLVFPFLFLKKKKKKFLNTVMYHDCLYVAPRCNANTIFFQVFFRGKIYA